MEQGQVVECFRDQANPPGAFAKSFCQSFQAVKMTLAYRVNTGFTYQLPYPSWLGRMGEQTRKMEQTLDGTSRTRLVAIETRHGNV